MILYGIFSLVSVVEEVKAAPRNPLARKAKPQSSSSSDDSSSSSSSDESDHEPGEAWLSIIHKIGNIRK